MVSDFVIFKASDVITISLNPCCNGIWSRTLICIRHLNFSSVLILVVMEYGLGLELCAMEIKEGLS